MKTEDILSLFKWLARIMYVGAIIGVLVQAGIFVTNFYLPDTPSPHNKINIPLYDLRIDHPELYFQLLCLTILLAIVKFLLWKNMADILGKISLSTPFTKPIASKLVNVGHVLVTISFLNFTSEYVLQQIAGIEGMAPLLASSFFKFDSDASYLLYAGVVYVMSQLFKRGVELQQENELTI
ncbi:hypothetical protein GCM10027275_03970 [Rhabdobacter roseus]|uniref:DUF2975 domain-containing protein n=1 Tax=Rhabdobacter roseus TaxID=1655419 RepID=A0A840TDU5_9BACT|nr:DUF2975 domain-containing protein [Rhabdobacter roseus]MBB5282286.1 hypothetical protein [Rhabdobacter roseus]